MPSITRCPDCNGQLQVPEEFFGRKVKCPTCGAQFTAQAEGGGGPPPELPGVPPPSAPPRPQWQEEDEEEFGEEDRPRRRRSRRRRDYEPHRGSTILVLGILGIVVCGPLSIFAWVMGNTDMRKIREGTMDPEGEGTTQAGRICGIVGTVLMIMQCAFFAIYLVIIFAVLGAHQGNLR
jgi:hypothetical protein